MKKTLFRTAVLMLAILLCTVMTVSCGTGNGKTLLTLNKDGVKVTLSVNFYELMMTRMKGVLYASETTHNGYDVSYDIFWDYQDTFNGKDFQTSEDFYSGLILENCKTYLAIRYLFEKNVGGLSTSAEEELDKVMDELLKTDGEGSKTKLNAVLSSYGVNADMLRDIYALEYQKDAVKVALFGKDASMVGDIKKNDYLNKNFARFRQVFFPTYNYVYEVDENNDEIYYYDEDSDTPGHIYYDKFNGVLGYNEDGTVKTDDKGDKIYFYPESHEKAGRIYYDVFNGVRSVVIENSLEKKTPMSAEEKEAVKQTATAAFQELQNSTTAFFETKVVEYELERGNETYNINYDEGIYLSKNINYTKYGFSYLDDILEKLDALQDDQVAIVESDQGFHIIRKYAPTENAYSKEINRDYFYNDYFNFTEDLAEQLLLDECELLYADIVISEKVLASAPKMRDVAINGIYTYY